MDDEGGSEELGLEKIFRLNCRAEQHRLLKIILKQNNDPILYFEPQNIYYHDKSLQTYGQNCIFEKYVEMIW